jgi:hypothetical protein
MNYILKNLVAQNSRKCDEVCVRQEGPTSARACHAPKFKQRRRARKPRVCGADEWMTNSSHPFFALFH